MNQRIRRLREQSLSAKPSISLERAVLLTEFYRSGAADEVSVPVARALAFKYIMENKTICINEGELIVGERGPAPKATPTYPEICTHTMKDFEILHGRKKIPFSVSDEARGIQEGTVIPFWKGKSIRERIFEEVDAEWKDAFVAGVFTEFMEQRAPGHTVLDDKIYGKGMLDFKREIEERIAELEEDEYGTADLDGQGTVDMKKHVTVDLDGQGTADQKEQLTAMAIAIDGLLAFARRHSEKALELAAAVEAPGEQALPGGWEDRERKRELEEIAATCQRVPAHAPRTFREALQYYWFVHLGVITELNTWDSFNPGRLDRHLRPFYSRELEEGTLTIEKARELLQAFWIKFNNQPAPPKVGVTAQESNTYTDFCLINVGGVDGNGRDATNELSYLILDVIEEMRLVQPSSMVQVSKKSPDRLLKRALGTIKTGYGQPSLFNTEAIVQELLRQGKSIFDARNGGASGCVETGAFGKESYILTGYFNLVKVLEITLHDGVDPRTGKRIGLRTGAPEEFRTFDDLFAAFRKQLEHFIDIKIRGNLVIERLYAKHLPAPFLSVLIDDCIANGKDYNAGGARYNTSYIQGVGLGTITDSLSAISHHVFDTESITMKEMTEALESDFKDREELHRTLWDETPRYGNDDPYPDGIMKRVFDAFFDLVDGRPTARGGQFRINLLPTTVHVYFGSVTGATPDGRRASEPLSEGISPVQGTDRYGPTAVLKSAARIDHIRTGGTLLNQKVTPQVLESQEGIDKLAHLVRAYFRMDGHHIQFNVVTGETLRKAQLHPEHHRDLIVRVAGYSDYFVDLGEDLQNEIIRRTEQALE